jgi:dolichol-phosphate mannosyltransferase
VSTTLRARRALRSPEAWMQLIRFSLVGGSGYIVNLAVFGVLTHAGTDHRLAALGAFLVAVTNNFAWNRRWTFDDARDGHAGRQAARFLTVSVGAFLISLGILEILVTQFDMADLPAQACAIVCATPLSFIGNRLWSFRA